MAHTCLIERFSQPGVTTVTITFLSISLASIRPRHQCTIVVTASPTSSPPYISHTQQTTLSMIQTTDSRTATTSSMFLDPCDDYAQLRSQLESMRGERDAHLHAYKREAARHEITTKCYEKQNADLGREIDALRLRAAELEEKAKVQEEERMQRELEERVQRGLEEEKERLKRRREERRKRLKEEEKKKAEKMLLARKTWTVDMVSDVVFAVTKMVRGG
jgi:hypothetical protein